MSLVDFQERKEFESFGIASEDKRGMDRLTQSDFMDLMIGLILKDEFFVNEEKQMVQEFLGDDSDSKEDSSQTSNC